MLAWSGARLIIRHARRWGLVDVPNERSSHALPRPRGGGIAIVAAFALVAPFALPGGVPLRSADGAFGGLWLGGAALVAAVGLVDDLRGLGQGLRLTVEAVAIGLALLGLAMLASETPVPGAVLAAAPPWSGSWPLALAAVLALVAGLWWINLFNFMDGIDGLAACQAIFMVLAGALLRAPDGAAGLTGAAIVPLAATLAGAVAGFLLLNWSPARIFMGDCGSLFLGFAIFTMALHDVTLGYASPWTWLILAALFLTDASVTLLRRLLRGDDIRKAHRSHAYQRLGRRLAGHAPATLVYCLVNVVWLLPLAWAVRTWPATGPVLAVVALAPLAGVMWWCGAGTPDR